MIRLRWAAGAAAGVFLVSAQVLAQETAFPPGCLGFLSVPRLKESLASAEGFTALFGHQLTSGVIQTWVGERVRNPGLLGVDPGGAFAVVWLDPRRFPSRAAYVVPINDPVLFAGAVGKNLSEVGEEKGIRRFEGVQWDRDAWNRATPAERRNMDQFKVRREQYVGFVGRQVVCADSRPACEAVLDWLRAGRLQLRARVSGHLQGAFDVGALLDVYRRRISLQREELLARTRRFTFQPGESVQDEIALSSSIEMQTDVALRLVEQVRDLHVAARFTPTQGLVVALSVTAREGTGLARFLAAQELRGPRLAALLPEDAIAAAAHNLVATPEMLAAWAEVLERQYRSVYGRELEPARRRELREALEERYRTAYAGPMAFAWLDSPPGAPALQAMRLYVVRDRAAVEAAWRSMADGACPLSRIYRELGLETYYGLRRIEPPRQLAGAVVNAWAVELDEARIPKESAAHIRSLFGGRLAACSALLGDLDVVTLGAEPSARMEQILALAKGAGKSLGASASYRAATAAAPQDWSFMGYASPSMLTRWLERFLRSRPPETGPQAPAPGIAVVGRVDGQRVDVWIVTPASEIMALLRSLLAPQQPAPKPPSHPAPAAPSGDRRPPPPTPGPPPSAPGNGGPR